MEIIVRVLNVSFGHMPVQLRRLGPTAGVLPLALVQMRCQHIGPSLSIKQKRLQMIRNEMIELTCEDWK